MKICPKCNAQLNDDAAFCTACGTQFQQQQQQQYQQPQYQQPQYQYAPQVDPYDHTAEFDAKDISENKVISMLVYLMGWIGIVIALLGSNTSKYAAFHVRQALKISVCEILIPIALAVCGIVNIIPFLGWLVYALVALAAAVAMVTLTVVKIICFFQICKGQAKEPPIVKKLNFLR